MAGSSTEFTKFIQDEVKKNEGVMMPVRASFFERMFLKWVPIKWLHPNPDDEFCFPNIGPNYGIISNYEKTFRTNNTMKPDSSYESLMVEKVHPSGYMILNGHHRWAAALRVGLKWAPVSIINLTSETDIRKMLESSEHDKRVTLDLDEVLFCTGEDIPQEKPLHFPFNKLYREPLRLGVPALLHFLRQQGYDVWIYSAGYYSYEYIRSYFKKHSAKVDGIITGTAKKTKRNSDEKKAVEQMFAAKYKETVHIDNSSLLRTMSGTGEFEEFSIECEPSEWTREVMNIVRGFKKDEKV